MKTVTLQKLANLLKNVTHATPVGLVVLTDARCRVTDNPWKDGVKKLTRLNAMIASNHEKAVQTQQAREGQEVTFKAAPRSWGTHISPALVSHKDSLYLSAQMNPLNHPRPIYLAPVARGKRTVLAMVPKAMLAPWLPAEGDERDAQGVARPVIHRDFRLDSIVQLTMGGEQYRVRQ